MTGAGQDGGQLLELLHAAWLAKKIIELVRSAALAQAAQDYTEELDRASRAWDCAGPGRRPMAVSDRERLFRREFTETARREMGSAGERMQRRAGAAGTGAETGLPASVQAAGQ